MTSHTPKMRLIKIAHNAPEAAREGPNGGFFIRRAGGGFKKDLRPSWRLCSASGIAAGSRFSWFEMVPESEVAHA